MLFLRIYLYAWGQEEEAEAAKEQVAVIKDRIARLLTSVVVRSRELTALVAYPFLMHPFLMVRMTLDNPEVRKWGEPTQFDLSQHTNTWSWTGYDCGKNSCRNPFLPLVVWALVWSVRLSTSWLDTHNQAGFKEWWPPVITNQDSLYGTLASKVWGLASFSLTFTSFQLLRFSSLTFTVMKFDASLKLPLLLYRVHPMLPSEEAGSADRDTPRYHPRSSVWQGRDGSSLQAWDPMNQLWVYIQGSWEDPSASGPLYHGYSLHYIDSLHVSATTRSSPCTIQARFLLAQTAGISRSKYSL